MAQAGARQRATRIWEERPGDPVQDEQWVEDSFWLAQQLWTAHSARYLAQVEPGVELWSVDAGLGNPHGERRLVWHVVESGRLYCEQCWGCRCCHSGAVLVYLHHHGERRVPWVEPTEEEREALERVNTAVWLRANGWC